MIIIPVKEGESIDRALKRYKRKYEKTGVVKELRDRQKFTKPSVIKRAQRLKAIYVQQLRQAEENAWSDVRLIQEYCQRKESHPQVRLFFVLTNTISCIIFAT